MAIISLDILVLIGIGLWMLWMRSTFPRRSKGGYLYPPGPKGLPIIGNYFDMPKSHEWKKAIEWSEKYGQDIVYVETLGSPSIFINSYATAVELLEKRSSNYSSRPRLIMANELEGWNWKTSLMPYGERLRKHRLYLQRFFQPSAILDYTDVEIRQTHKLLCSLLKSPGDMHDSIRRSIGAVIMMVAYGHEVSENNDVFVMIADDGLRALGEVLVHGKFLVDLLPWLRYVPEWFPGAGFKKIAKNGFKLSQAMVHEPHNMTKQKVLNGTAIPSITSRLIESNMAEDGHIHDEDVIENVTGIAYTGGTDTTVSVLLTFMLAMTLYPEVQNRAQEELDRVIGKDNLPTFEDRDNLPYVNAICTEALRWEVVLPLGVSHATLEDDVYNDMFIPAGTALLPNQWAMLRDPKEYPNPDVFMPERWLAQEGQQPPLHPNKITFGFGRRICPGRHLAEQMIFITVASILSAFKIRGPEGDARTKETPLRGDYFESFIRNALKLLFTNLASLLTYLCRHPEHFKCSIIPRSERMEESIRQLV